MNGMEMVEFKPCLWMEAEIDINYVIYSLDELRYWVPLNDIHQIRMVKLSLETDCEVAQAALRNVYHVCASQLPNNTDQWPLQIPNEWLVTFKSLFLADSQVAEMDEMKQSEEFEELFFQAMFSAGFRHLENLISRCTPEYREKILARETIKPCVLIRDALELNPMIGREVISIEHLFDTAHHIWLICKLTCESPPKMKEIEAQLKFYQELLTNPKHTRTTQHDAINTPIHPSDCFFVFSCSFLSLYPLVLHHEEDSWGGEFAYFDLKSADSEEGFPITPFEAAYLIIKDELAEILTIPNLKYISKKIENQVYCSNDLEILPPNLKSLIKIIELTCRQDALGNCFPFFLDVLTGFAEDLLSDKRPPDLALFARQSWSDCKDIIYGYNLPVVKIEAFEDKCCLILSDFWESHPLSTHEEAVEHLIKTFFESNALVEDGEKEKGEEISDGPACSKEHEEGMAWMIYKTWWFGKYLLGSPLAMTDRLADWYVIEILNKENNWHLPDEALTELIKDRVRLDYPNVPLNMARISSVIFKMKVEYKKRNSMSYSL